MRKEYIISVELDKETEQALYDLRWKHIDIDSLIEDELRAQIGAIVRACVGVYGEVV